MCRLFALSSSPTPVHATFWLLSAPDSMKNQSRRNPDGTGLGYFKDDGRPVIDKEPLPAFEDRAYLREARQVRSKMFVSHIRFATIGPKIQENCQPFEMDGRIFAHNGALGDLDRVEARLGDVRALIKGQTDSERYFALLTQQIRQHGGDVESGISATVRWLAESVPVYSLNFVLATADQLWAFRYPETDTLYYLERESGGHHKNRDLHYVSDSLRVHSPHLRERCSVIVASECLDDHPDWKPFRSGELLHVTPDLTVTTKLLLERPPASRLVLHHPA